MEVEAGGERGQRVEEHVTRWVMHSGLFFVCVGGANVFSKAKH